MWSLEQSPEDLFSEHRSLMRWENPLFRRENRENSRRETVSMEYALEYGTGTIELHKDSIRPGQKVVIIDDLIATGGTVEAIAKLVEELGGEVVKICFVMELAGLKGRDKLQKYDVDSAIIYEGK